MFEQVLAKPTKKLLDKASQAKWLADFYLAGGTALALQYGHRQSVDLDWFTVGEINSKELIKNLSKLGKFKLISEDKNTVEGQWDGVKVSFMTYPYSSLHKLVQYKQNVKLAHPKDIAVMKVGAVAGRNTRKDFIDIYTFLQKENLCLQDLFKLVSKRFKGVDYDLYHIYCSLVYFKEADKEPMPRMLEKVSWSQIKKFFIQEVAKLKK